MKASEIRSAVGKGVLLLSLVACLCLCLFSCGDGESAPADVAVDSSMQVVYSSSSGTIGLAKFYTESVKTQHGVELEVKKYSAISESDTGLLLVGATEHPLSVRAAELLASAKREGAESYVILADGGNCAVIGEGYKITRYALNKLAAKYPESIPGGLSVTELVTEGQLACFDLMAPSYTAAELDAIAIANSITLNGDGLEDFQPSVTEYSVLLAFREEYPTVSVSVPAGTKAVITQATDATSSATVALTSPDGKVSQQYILNFEKSEFRQMKNVKIEKVYGGRDAIAVIIHDDGNRATGTFLKEQFLTHSLKGTLGLIGKAFVRRADGSAIGTDQVDFETMQINTAEVAFWQDLLDTGLFDVASHTMTHTFWGLTDEAESGNIKGSGGTLTPYSYEAGQITYEVAGSRRLFELLFPGQTVKTLIKAGFGRHENGVQISDKAFEIIKENYIAMRNSSGGMETIPIGDAYWMKCIQASQNDTSDTYINAVKTAIEQGGMQIFLFHQIQDTPSSSLTASKEAASGFFGWLSGEVEKGTVWNAFYEDAVMYTEECRTAKVEALEYEDRIEITLTDGLDNTVYSHELTVRIPASDGQSYTVTYADGRTECLELLSDAEGYYLHLNLLPDSGKAVVSWTK